MRLDLKLLKSQSNTHKMSVLDFWGKFFGVFNSSKVRLLQYTVMKPKQLVFSVSDNHYFNKT